MNSPIILVRVPFRISLGGGSTDLPSYYRKYGGFVFGVTINLYMDILIKSTKSDNLIHVHYRQFETVDHPKKVEHELAREALLALGINNSVAISFKADTPAGTGLGSSGACVVALLKGLSVFAGKKISNKIAAEKSFSITRKLGLPDGPQDPYLCSMGGFTALNISKDGNIKITKPKIEEEISKKFFDNTLFFYTGVKRDSSKILVAQDNKKALELKHKTKSIGLEIYESFKTGDLESFGTLLDDHWRIKREISGQISNPIFDEIYEKAKRAGALGGKIMGAGGGGYFMFYCGSKKVKNNVRQVLKTSRMKEMFFNLDPLGARHRVLSL
jgi:D-glycero-alpha-D-manno-heptose-7-phosphate kinase